MASTREIEIEYDKGKRTVVEVELGGAGYDVSVCIKRDSKAVFSIDKFQGSDYFEVLMKMREDVEKRGYKILVKGSLRNVFPSGMQRDMGSGLKAYRFYERGRESMEAVDIFDPVEPDEIGGIVTYEEQKAFYLRWITSVR